MEITIQHQAPKGWDDFLLKCPSGNVHQTTAYAGYVEKVTGQKARFALAQENDLPVGALLFFESSAMAGAAKHPVFGPFARAISKAFPVITWHSGPVASHDLAFRALLKKAVDYAVEHRIPITLALPQPLNDSSYFSELGFSATPKATFVVDLSVGKDALWQKVDHPARKLVRRTAEQGVVVRELSTQNEFQQYVDVVNLGRRRAGIAEYSFSDVHGVWEHLHLAGMYTVFGAYFENRLLSGLGVSFFNGYVHEWGAGTSTEALEKKIYAGDLLKWHVIEWASGRGFSRFDLSGVSPNPSTEKEKGIYRFKEKWGGSRVDYHEYSYGVPRKRDAVIRFVKAFVKKKVVTGS